MNGDRRGGRAAVTASHTSRWSASFAVAVAAHAAVLALLAGSAIVRLDVVPASIELAFLEPSDRTAAPGETAPELRLAAPAAAPPAPAPPAREVETPEPVVEPPEPVARLEPAPVAKPKPETKPKPNPQTNPQTKPQPATLAKQPAPPADVASPSASSGDAPAVATPGQDGSDDRATAPDWAPSARVRYEQVLFAWMDRHKQYPMLAQRRGLEGSGSVRVRIGRDGRVLERVVTRTTGEQMLDQAALDMVRRASPFPAVPPEYAGDSFEFVAPIEYRLR